MDEILFWHLDTARIWLKEKGKPHIEVMDNNWTYAFPKGKDVFECPILYIENGLIIAIEEYEDLSL